LIGRNYGPVPPRPWFIQRAEGGGQLLERGSHHVDLQRALVGEVDSVSAVAATPDTPARATNGDIEDFTLATLHFANGAIGSVAVAWTADDHPEHYSMDVIAGEATLFIEHGSRLDGEYEDPFRRSSERFLAAMASGEPERVFCTPADALRTLRVVQACEQALASGDRVPVVA